MRRRLRKVMRSGAETRWRVEVDDWSWTRKRSMSWMRMRNCGTQEFWRAANRSYKTSVVGRGGSDGEEGRGVRALDGPAPGVHSANDERIMRRNVTLRIPRSRSIPSTVAVKTTWQWRCHSSSRTLPTSPPQLLASRERTRRIVELLSLLLRLPVRKGLRLTDDEEGESAKLKVTVRLMTASSRTIVQCIVLLTAVRVHESTDKFRIMSRALEVGWGKSIENKAPRSAWFNSLNFFSFLWIKWKEKLRKNKRREREREKSHVVYSLEDKLLVCWFSIKSRRVTAAASHCLGSLHKSTAR